MVSTDPNKLYTGIATDVERRFSEHRDTFERKNNAKGAKFFRAHKPCKVELKTLCENRSEALKLEARIKKMSRKEKLRLIDGGII